MTDNNEPTDTALEHKYDKSRVKTLLEDVMYLAEYALERGSLSDSVDIATLLELQQYKEEVERIPSESLPTLAKYYEILSLELAPVTADTLRATARTTRRHRDTIVGRHIQNLWLITSSMIILILGIDIVEFIYGSAGQEPGDELTFPAIVHQIQTRVIPFAYGALGSCAYLLRVTEKYLRSREFSPVRIPEHWNRLLLGALSGGVIVLFIQQNGDSIGVELGQAALGFLAGYSIDFLFDTLDRMITALLPKAGIDAVASRLDQRKQKLLITRYEKMLIDPNRNDEEKEIIRKVVSDLKA